jgi:hypothetical protein
MVYSASSSSGPPSASADDSFGQTTAKSRRSRVDARAQASKQRASSAHGSLTQSSAPTTASAQASAPMPTTATPNPGFTAGGAAQKSRGPKAMQAAPEVFRRPQNAREVEVRFTSDGKALDPQATRRRVRGGLGVQSRSVAKQQHLSAIKAASTAQGRQCVRSLAPTPRQQTWAVRALFHEPLLLEAPGLYGEGVRIKGERCALILANPSHLSHLSAEQTLLVA